MLQITRKIRLEKLGRPKNKQTGNPVNSDEFCLNTVFRGEFTVFTHNVVITFISHVKPKSTKMESIIMDKELWEFREARLSLAK